MNEAQEGRLVAAFEKIAEAFDFIAGTLESIDTTIAQHHAKTFPAKRYAEDATISKIKSDEEKLREEQGQTDESLKDWTTLHEEEIGPREKAWLEEHQEKAGAKKA